MKRCLELEVIPLRMIFSLPQWRQAIRIVTMFVSVQCLSTLNHYPQAVMAAGKPVNWIAAAVVVIVWVSLAALAVYLVARL